MTNEKTHPVAGDAVIVTLKKDGDAEPLYYAELMVEQAPAGDVARSSHQEDEEEVQYRTRVVREAWRSEEDKRFHVPQQEGLRASIADGLKVAEFAWKFIDANRPVARSKGTMTSVVAADSTALDYTGAREGRSSPMVLSVTDSLITSLEYIHVKFRLEGAYAAKPAKEGIPNGAYLPSVYFNVLECWATWQTWVEAFAEVAGPYDPGTPSNRAPEIKVYGKFSFGWVGSANNVTCGFRASGPVGFDTTGWESAPLPPEPVPTP